jgi:multidrug efflux pump subunit AcrB
MHNVEVMMLTLLQFFFGYVAITWLPIHNLPNIEPRCSYK